MLFRKSSGCRRFGLGDRLFMYWFKSANSVAVGVTFLKDWYKASLQFRPLSVYFLLGEEVDIAIIGY